MSLEFTKLVEQVQTFGRYLAHVNQTATDKLSKALDLLFAATDLEAIRQLIHRVRTSSVSGYRGAAPAPDPISEIICGIGETPAAPQQATIIAADGSQIYPDQHAPAVYYLINLGAFAYFHGQPRVPYQATFPNLVYNETALFDKDGRAITNQTVNARRSVQEMALLADMVWELRTEARPLIAFHDGGLLKFFGANEVAGAGQIEHDYLNALQKLHDGGAVLLGFSERSRSTNVISLLHLLSLPDQAVTDANLKTNGELEGLLDTMLFGAFLEPGWRSAIFTQNSPQNKDYKDQRGSNFEIGFFYINVAETNAPRPIIVRVELPMWVAQDAAAVDAAHALIMAQCGIQGASAIPTR
ncbi:DNA double-strand break repair nuclease NurA [Kamptonema cortianum]|nr:DNA double-strand break repair nuclease NurA [Kamptonema cortianum]